MKRTGGAIKPHEETNRESLIYIEASVPGTLFGPRETPCVSDLLTIRNPIPAYFSRGSIRRAKRRPLPCTGGGIAQPDMQASQQVRTALARGAAGSVLPATARPSQHAEAAWGSQRRAELRPGLARRQTRRLMWEFIPRRVSFSRFTALLEVQTGEIQPPGSLRRPRDGRMVEHRGRGRPRTVVQNEQIGWIRWSSASAANSAPG